MKFFFIYKRGISLKQAKMLMQ